ncbi:MAG: hypothetical protein AB7S93_07620 [Xanthobacteraceae bacterium]
MWLQVATGIVMLTLIAPAAAQYRSLPPSPAQMPPPSPAPMLPPLPAPMTVPRPPPEIAAPVPVVPEGEARQTERVCIEKEMCVDVPVSQQAQPGSGERK